MLGFLALCVVGILIHYSLMFMLATISFWTVRAQGIVYGYYNLFNIARMPDEAFRGRVQSGVHLRAADAAGLERAGAPADGHVDIPQRWLLLLLGMAVVCAVVSEWVWRMSVRRYTSASS